MQSELKDFFGEPVFVYTAEQAVEDGILADIGRINPVWKSGIFNHVTANLLHKGYVKNEKIDLPCLQDLLQQALDIVNRKSKEQEEPDWLYTGEIELPSGMKQEIFIQQNETGKYTLMLPEDY